MLSLSLAIPIGLTQRAIARSLGLSQGAVCDYLGRARRAGLSWPAVSSLDDAELDRLLFPPPPAIPAEQRPQPDWTVIHRELRQSGDRARRRTVMSSRPSCDRAQSATALAWPVTFP